MEEADEFVFLLMDFVDGVTLRKEILAKNDIPFTRERVLEIMTEVCSALDHSHQ
jgi:serine/threonine protein kinase